MTWGEYVDLVESHLSVEANRRGMESFRARYMRNAVLDLQRYIAGYRSGMVTTYTAAQVNEMTSASLGTLPPQSKPKAFYIICAQGDSPLPPTESAITSWAELAEVLTEHLAVGTMRYWVDADTGILQVVQLRTATTATDTASGIQRPDDYADPGNTKVWFKTN